MGLRSALRWMLGVAIFVGGFYFLLSNRIFGFLFLVGFLVIVPASIFAPMYLVPLSKRESREIGEYHEHKDQLTAKYTERWRDTSLPDAERLRMIHAKVPDWKLLSTTRIVPLGSERRLTNAMQKLAEMGAPDVCPHRVWVHSWFWRLKDPFFSTPPFHPRKAVDYCVCTSCGKWMRVEDWVDEVPALKQDRYRERQHWIDMYLTA